MKGLKKLEKKIEKKVIKQKESGILSRLNNIGGSIRRGLNDSSIGITTPWGGIGYGLKGLILNPPGSSNNVMSSTISRTGKRSYYITGRAPPKTGFKSGLRIVACQKIADIVQSSTDTSALFPTSAGARAASLGLSPDDIGGQMALDARNYNRYRFSQVALEYIPSVAASATAVGSMTTIAQNFCLAFSCDGAMPTFLTPTSDNVQSIADNTVIPVWTQGGLLVQNYGTPQTLYYTEIDSTSAASNRQCKQGLILGLWNTSPVGTTSNTVVGDLIMHYVLDLYDRSPDYGFTLTVDHTIGWEVLETLFKTYGDKLSRRDRSRLLTHLHPPTKVDEIDGDLWSVLSSKPSSSPHSFVELKSDFKVDALPPSPLVEFKTNKKLK